MFDSNNFTAWALFTDFAFMAALLLVGKLLRSHVKCIQQLFIPPSLIAGLLGLVMGPNGMGWLPFSQSIGTYSAIFIAMVFGALPLSSAGTSFKGQGKRLGGMWAYGQIGMLGQWGIMGVLGIAVFCAIWPELHPAFGIMLPTGFYGGHGTAAAIGSSFTHLGWEDAFSLGMTTATVGVFVAIVLGLLIIKWGARKGYTRFIADFKDLPDELRSGLLPKGKRDALGEETTSSISIESMTFHLCMVLVVAFGGYMFSRGVKILNSRLELPVFSCAYIVGLLFMQIMRKTKANNYICPKTMGRISSSCTDFLVAFGIASIKLNVVLEYALPLIVLVVTGIVLVYFFAIVIGRITMREYWFEKAIFCWGWWTGTMAMGMALLRIVDARNRSRALDDFALVYLPMAPVEILLITFAPLAFVNGWGLWFSLACILLCLFIFALGRFSGWWQTKPKAADKAT